MLEVMESHPEYEWILFLDPDMGVINPQRRIEEFVDDELDMVFYDRAYVFEIMAGSYIAR
jgi:hypothetical protein